MVATETTFPLKDWFDKKKKILRNFENTRILFFINSRFHEK